ncbi:MAG: hypothetical protein ACI8TP_001457 [Acidimicrobiales bacterium]|jgi:hypothetical protein
MELGVADAEESGGTQSGGSGNTIDLEEAINV